MQIVTVLEIGDREYFFPHTGAHHQSQSRFSVEMKVLFDISTSPGDDSFIGYVFDNCSTSSWVDIEIEKGYWYSIENGYFSELHSELAGRIMVEIGQSEEDQQDEKLMLEKKAPRDPLPRGCCRLLIPP